MKERELRISVPNQFHLHKAAVQVGRLYDAWGKPAKATEWKVTLGMPDLPAEVLARP